MNADFTYDSATDQFVVTLDDGTEVCRTRAPHTQNSKKAVQRIVDGINGNPLNRGDTVMQLTDGSWYYRCDSSLVDDMVKDNIIFDNYHD